MKIRSVYRRHMIQQVRLGKYRILRNTKRKVLKLYFRDMNREPICIMLRDTGSEVRLPWVLISAWSLCSALGM